MSETVAAVLDSVSQKKRVERGIPGTETPRKVRCGMLRMRPKAVKQNGARRPSLANSLPVVQAVTTGKNGTALSHEKKMRNKIVR